MAFSKHEGLLMNRIGKIAVTSLCMCGLLGASVSAMAESPQQRDASELARYQRFAGPTQDSMRFFHLDNFQYLGENAQGDKTIAVFTGVNNVYLFTVQSPCLDLENAFAIGVTSGAGSVHARFDSITYGHHGNCRIATIRKVDYKAMQAERASGEKAR